MSGTSSNCEKLLQHLQALKTFLESLRTSPTLEDVLEKRTESVGRLISAANLSLSDAALVNDLLAQMLWTPTQLQSLQNTVALRAQAQEDQATDVSVQAGRTKLQDYTSLMHYLREADWDSITAGSDQVMHNMIEHLVALGLRNPSESTMQAMTAVFLFITEKEPMSIPPAMKLEVLKALKARLKQAAKGPALAYPLLLSKNVGEFKQMHQNLWNAAFGPSGHPAASKLGVAELQRLMASCPMRITRADSKATSLCVPAPRHPQQHQPQQLDALLNAPAAQQFANHIFNQMQVMQRQQESMAQVLSSLSSQPLVQVMEPNGRFLKRVQTLHSLQDAPAPSAVPQPSLQAAEAAHVAHPEAPPAALQTVEAAVKRPTLPAADASVVTLGAPPAALQTAAKAEATVKRPKLSAADASAVMLQAMKTRDENRADEASTGDGKGDAKAKAKAKAAGKAMGKAKAKAKAKGKPAQAKAKAKAKAQAKAKAKAKTKAQAPSNMHKIEKYTAAQSVGIRVRGGKQLFSIRYKTKKGKYENLVQIGLDLCEMLDAGESLETCKAKALKLL